MDEKLYSQICGTKVGPPYKKRRLRDQKWIKDLSNYCMRKCQAHGGDTSQMTQFFTGKNNAWFINSRFINFPARAEGLLSLIDDVEEAGKKNHKSSWKFNHVIMVITRLYPKSTNEEATGITYRNPEDELFEQGAEFKLEWNAENDIIGQDEQKGSGWDDDELYTQHRMIVVLQFEKLKQLIQMLPAWLTAQ